MFYVFWSGMVIMRVEGVIPTQEELTHMVAEVDQVNIWCQMLNMRSATALKLDSNVMRTFIAEAL